MSADRSVFSYSAQYSFTVSKYLHSLNIFASDDSARVVDCAWSQWGNPAVDTAFLIPRLIAAGHEPKAAERWAESVLCWRATPAATRTAFAIAIWGIWNCWNGTTPRRTARHSPLLRGRERSTVLTLVRKGVGRPMAKLVAVEEPPDRELGFVPCRVPDSFDDPLPEDELAAWEA